MANRDYRILLGVGAVLIVAGLVATAWSFIPYAGTETRTIPIAPDIKDPLNSTSGLGLWTLMKVSMWFQGKFTGTYVVTATRNYNHGILILDMIDQSEYNSYKETGVLHSVFFSLANNNTIEDFHLPTSGNYYIVLFNALPLQSEVNATIHYRVSGLNLEFLAPGLVSLLVAGLVFILCGQVEKGKGFEPRLGKDLRGGKAIADCHHWRVGLADSS